MTNHPLTHRAPSGGHFPPEALSALLDGETAGAPPEQIEAHLETCPGCRRQYEQLAEVRGLVGALATPAPPGGAATAVAAALEAAREAAPAGPGGTDKRLVSPADLRRRQQRLRVAAVAASALLVAGGVGGLALALAHGGSASSGASGSALAPVRHSPSPKSRPGGGAAESVQLEGSSHRPSGHALAGLVRGDVAAIRISRGAGGTFTATIALARQHPLTSVAVAGLRAGRASALLSGRTTGVVHVISAHLVEISGLTRSETTELKRLLG